MRPERRWEWRRTITGIYRGLAGSVKILLLAVLCAGCVHWPGADQHEHRKPWPIGAGAKDGRALTSATQGKAAPGMPRITLAWDCQVASAAAMNHWETGLTASTDLVHWVEAAVLAYPTNGSARVTLTNRPAFEFYRAFNRVKGL